MNDFGTELARLMAARGVGVRELARRAHYNAGHISNLRNGRARPSPELAADLDAALGADGALAALAPGPAARAPHGPGDQADDEIAAIELGRRAEASDVGNETAGRLALAVDDLATAYPGTPPGELLGRVRAHLGYVGQLLGARTTLAQHRGLLVTGGWLSLLAATCLIDLHRDAAAAAHLRTAAQFARETGHAEIAAWCIETQAWQVLTEGTTGARPGWRRRRSASRRTGGAPTFRPPRRKAARGHGSVPRRRRGPRCAATAARSAPPARRPVAGGALHDGRPRG